MQLALIPPKGWENYIHLSSFQLALAHIDAGDYLREYAKAERRGDFIVLDNGIAEDEHLSTKALVITSTRIGASELVLPDVMHDGNRTLSAIGKFLKEAKQLPKPYTTGLRLMAVAHGNNTDDIQALITQYVDIAEIDTVGLPRCLVTQWKPAMRIDLANWTHETYPNRFQIHFLGTSHWWPREIAQAAHYAPHVRSVDTSMPFNYALAGERLDVKKPAAVKRPDGYFKDVRDFDPDLLRRNIQTMFGWLDVEAPVS